MPRFAIRNFKGLFYTDNLVPETTYVPRADNPRVAEPVSILKPIFGTMDVLQALKYSELADAKVMFTYPHLQDPAAFADCEVVECEFDQSDPSAVRSV